MNPKEMEGLILQDLGSANSFEQYVSEWAALKALQEIIKKAELAARKHITAAAFPQAGSPDCAEGVHHFEMIDGRKLTYTRKVTRSIDETQIAASREAYALLNDRPVEFDDLLKVSYELSITSFRKLDPASEASTVIAGMVTAKASETPDLKVS